MSSLAPYPEGIGGNRAANNALCTVVLTRLRLDERDLPLRVARRTTESLNHRVLTTSPLRGVPYLVAAELIRVPQEGSNSWLAILYPTFRHAASV